MIKAEIGFMVLYTYITHIGVIIMRIMNCVEVACRREAVGEDGDDDDVEYNLPYVVTPGTSRSSYTTPNTKVAGNSMNENSF